MKKNKNCNKCGKKVYSNQKNCTTCVDIILYGSVKKAKESARKNFKKLGL